MADFTALKTAIQSYIKQNGNEEITGNILQEVLLSMVQTMGDGAINDLVTALSNEVTARVNADTSLQNAINTINSKLAEGYVCVGVATPTTNPGTPTGKVFYIATAAGTYTNFGSLVVTQGINILKYDGSDWSQEQVFGVDDDPTAGSSGLVKSGGVFNNIGALDISELNATENPHTLAQYIDLSAALAAIPAEYKKGGMSIKFVQSSDNKYVQYRLLLSEFTAAQFTNTANWQKQGAEVTVSQNIVTTNINVGGVGYNVSTTPTLVTDVPMGIDIKGNATYENGYVFTTYHQAVSGWSNYLIEVIEGETFIVKGTAGLSFPLWVLIDASQQTAILSCEYDGSVKNFSEELIVPRGAKYLVLNTRNDAIPDNVSIILKEKTAEQLSINGVPYNLRDSNLPPLEKSVEGMIKMQKEVDADIISDATYEDGYVFTTYHQAVSGWSNYLIEVSPNELYTLYGTAGLSFPLWVLIDASQQTAILSCEYDGTVKFFKEDVTIPSGAKYLVLNTRNDAITNDGVAIIAKSVERVSAAKVYLTHTLSLSESKKSNILYGKTLVTCGDSITFGSSAGITRGKVPTYIRDWEQMDTNFIPQSDTATYPGYGYLIAERNNMIYYNDGVSGSTIQVVEGLGGFAQPNGRYTTLPDNIDYLTIWFGWNDAARGTLGTINDSTPNTFYGAYNVVLPYLINKYPYTKIALIVPYIDNTALRQAVRDVANKWGVAYFDMFQAGTPLFFCKESSVEVEQSVITENRKKFLADGVHPNRQGYIQLADMIEHFLRGI